MTTSLTCLKQMPRLVRLNGAISWRRLTIDKLLRNFEKSLCDYENWDRAAHEWKKIIFLKKYFIIYLVVYNILYIFVTQLDARATGKGSAKAKRSFNPSHLQQVASCMISGKAVTRCSSLQDCQKQTQTKTQHFLEQRAQSQACLSYAESRQNC